MDQAIPRRGVEETTELALQEKGKLVKSLSRLDMVGFTVCAFVGLDTLGTVASNGGQGFTWLIVLALVFVLPYALLMAEVGSAFTQEGGPYEWSKMAFGRLQGAIAAVLYWVTNPLWVGGSLAFIATEAWNDNIFKIHSGGGRRLPLQVPLHLAVDRRRHRLAQARQVDPERRRAHAHRRPGPLHASRRSSTRSSTAWHGFPVSDLKPTGAIFLALVPLLLFNYVGFELQNGAAEEMNDPQKDVPLSVLRSGDHRRAALRDPGLRDPDRPAGREGHRHRRLPRRGDRDLHRLRRRAELPARR